MKAVIDRIDGGMAIITLQDDTSVILNIPLKHIPNVCEGDIVDITINKDETATRAARERVSSIIERLKKRT